MSLGHTAISLFKGTELKPVRAAQYVLGKSLARKYGVSVATISMIRNRRIWTHI